MNFDEIDRNHKRKAKMNRLKWYEKNQYKGLRVKKANGKVVNLTPLDLKDLIKALKIELL